MAAEPASPLKDSHVSDYFEVFGLPRRFAIDRGALERKFYELSRATHPDRFATAGSDQVRQAVERMSLLNDAYRTLKDPAELRRYFLSLQGFDTSAEKGQLPAELAESWFEVQDVLIDEPAQAEVKIAEFEKLLGSVRERGVAELLAAETAIDACPGEIPVASLKRLSDAVRAQSYLQSLERDVERIVRQLKARK